MSDFLYAVPSRKGIMTFENSEEAEDWRTGEGRFDQTGPVEKIELIEVEPIISEIYATIDPGKTRKQDTIDFHDTLSEAEATGRKVFKGLTR